MLRIFDSTHHDVGHLQQVQQHLSRWRHGDGERPEDGGSRGRLFPHLNKYHETHKVE